MPKHKVKLQYQKVAVSRAHDILQKEYPVRIAQKRANEEGAKLHLAYLLAAMETLDMLERGVDMREDL